jgi:hypothetical protein
MMTKLCNNKEKRRDRLAKTTTQVASPDGETAWLASLYRQILLEDAPNAKLIYLLSDPGLSSEPRVAIRAELRFRLEELVY